MRLVELHHGGERPFVLDLHPRVTVLTGLGPHGRPWLRDLLAAAIRGDRPGVAVTVDLDGTHQRLTAALAGGLGLPDDLAPVLRAADLPGVRVVGPVDAGAGPDPAGGDAVRADLAVALEALRRASENRAAAERALAAIDGEPAGDAAAVEAAERALAEARARRADAAARVEALRPERDRARRLAARTAELTRRRDAVLEALDRLDVRDPAPVAAALAAARRDGEPAADPAAVALADELEAVRARLGALGPLPPNTAALVDEARRALDAARAELAAAQAALAPHAVSEDDARRIDELHEAVVAAEARANRRVATPLARRRLRDAEAAEAHFLQTLGFSSYSAYLLNSRPLVVDAGAQARVAEAARAVADAEAVWEEVTAATALAARDALAAREAALVEQARGLLGEPVAPDAIVAALRARRVPPPPDDAPLRAALDAEGVDPGDDPHAAAQAWLAAADEAHARRAALQAELGALTNDLEVVRAEAAAAAGAPPEAELDAAVAALDAATAAEAAAAASLDQVRRDVATRRAAAAQVDALRADLAGAVAAEEQAATRVAQLEAALAAASVAATTGPAVLDLTDRKPAAVDTSGVDRKELEVFVLAKVAALRSVGAAGAVPLVVDDAFGGLPLELHLVVLELLERYSEIVQVVYLSDEPLVEQWARELGPGVAALRRFSWAQADSRV